MMRQQLLDQLEQDWDVVVIGGGITGAGVFQRACQRGWRCLLVEQRDFAWGTSSRSGKLVHGGLRYIAQGQLLTSLHAVRQRERLLREYAGLVEPLQFAFARPRGGPPMWLATNVVLALYDLMAGRWGHRYYGEQEFRQLAPGLTTIGRGGFVYLDGSTDDARLVLRVIREGQRLGGTAINYLQVTDLLRTKDGQVRGVALQDAEGDRSWEIQARVVINATGAWADHLRGQLGQPPRLRQLRGSHLIFAGDRLPLPRAVGIRSPRDQRMMYVIPWQGATLVGTTDLDHDQPLSQEPRITAAEGAYLLEAVNHWFPEARLTEADVLATQGGVRPVVGTGKKDPSKESRDESVWRDPGMITVAGGKLTTFSLMARRALAAAGRSLGKPPRSREPGRAPLPAIEEDPIRRRLSGRYGAVTEQVLALTEGEPRPIANTQFILAELRWAVRNEQVVHLDDLLLRRTRLGLLLRQGGAAVLDEIRDTVESDLAWNDARWKQEIAAYRELWGQAYAPDLLG